MAFTQKDVFAIQGAIDAYEKRFPRRPSPSAAEALVWQACGRASQLPSGLVLHDALQDVTVSEKALVQLPLRYSFASFGPSRPACSTSTIASLQEPPLSADPCIPSSTGFRHLAASR